MTFLLLTITIVIIQRLSELFIARRNYKWALSKGGQELGQNHYPLFIFLHSGWLFSWIFEWYFRRPESPLIWPLLLVSVLLAQLLRYWVIKTLGKRWNTRIVIIPDQPLVNSGPYRFLKHPNYLAVIVELAAFPALFGCWYTAIIFSILNMILLLLIRIPAEEKALQTCARDDQDLRC